ncbi:hypothetical protein [Streptococcus marmotae]|uniref:hypothetical protein n=1 Tax=Streptococcus marmotae TaxID=1825069 RepID=UPI000830FDED|nr:hypothetical protein [Streptococcus marmotae]
MNLNDLEQLLTIVPNKYHLQNIAERTSYEEYIRETQQQVSVQQFYDAYYQFPDNGLESQKQTDLEKLKDGIILLERLESILGWKMATLQLVKRRCNVATFLGAMIYWNILVYIIFNPITLFSANPVIVLGLAIVPIIILRRFVKRYLTTFYKLEEIDSLYQAHFQYTLTNPFLYYLDTDFTTSNTLHTIRNLILSGRVDTLKEGLNLYALDVRNLRIEESMHAAVADINPPTFGSAISDEIRKLLGK